METLIFIDFETTGLPEDNPSNPLFDRYQFKETPKDRTLRLERILLTDGNGNRTPRITELSLVSVPRSLFSAAANQMADDSQFVSEQGTMEPIPVVANIHTRQLNPQLSQLEWEKYEQLRQKTPSIQLRKCELECKNTFAQEWPGVVQMLELVPKPACLVAHNGLTFDFRLLFHELRRADLLSKFPIPDNIFFADSFHAFLDIETEFNQQIEIATQHINWPLVFSQSTHRLPADSPGSLAAEDPFAAHGLVDSPQPVGNGQPAFGIAIGMPNGQQEAGNRDERNVLRRPSEFERERSQRTPEKREPTTAVAAGPRPSAKRALFMDAPSQPHPMDFMRKDRWSPAKRRRINPELFMKSSQGHWDYNSFAARRELVTRGTFRLDALFTRLFSAPFKNHRAQADSEALLQVCLAYGLDFLSFVDRNSSAFPACFRKNVV